MGKILSENGFTLLEIIVSMILAGIIVVFAGMGIISVVEGLAFTKQNAETTQKAQVAVNRLVKEISVMNGVTTGNNKSISFTSYKLGVSVGQTISWSGTTGDPLYLDSDVLTGNVSNFELAYYNSHNESKLSTWSASTKIIEIALTLKAADNVDSVFTARVIPRNM
jgi:prepilin-type N-terminal cleavage/methylation domain-containing protein